MASEKTKAKAIEALEGMRVIVKREMLKRGHYVSDKVYDGKLAEDGALCQGRKYCAIGSLWVGAGVPLNVNKYDVYDYGKRKYVNVVNVTLPGTEEYERDNFLRNRPGLKLAYKCLNEAARDHAKKFGVEDIIKDSYFEAEIEALFESKSRRKGAKLGRPELLKLITAAKRKVNAA